MIKMSIIVPIYNSAKFLQRCIQSLLHQTLEEIEIILIDDCSTDNSKEIIQSYIDCYESKIKAIYLSENRKQGYARNIGMKYARGEYIAFLDSDDYFDLEMCQLTYTMAKEEGYDIVCFDWVAVYDNFQNINRLAYSEDITGIITDEKRKKILNSSGYFTTRIYKKDFLIRNNLKFPENIFYEDSPFNFLSLLNAKSIAKIDKALYFYVQRDGSSSNCRNQERLYDRILTLEYMLEQIQKRNIYEFNKDYIEEKYLKMAVGNIHLCLDMFDKPNKDQLKKISFNINKNLKYYKNSDSYRRLDKVSKCYIEINRLSPKALIMLDFIYKKSLKLLKI